MCPGHPNAPLTPSGRRRLSERIDAGHPISHVAAEAGVSRRCLAKRYTRWLADGPTGWKTAHRHRNARRAGPGRRRVLTDNGEVERFNGTLAREWAYVTEYNSEQERRAALVDFLNHYNYERPHSALGYRPPSSRVPVDTYRLTAEGRADDGISLLGPTIFKVRD